MQATRWRLSLARGVAEWIYRGKVNGKGKGEAKKAGRERSSSDPFSLALQRYADVGERKRTAEKLKWTLTGICAAEREMEFQRTSALLHLWLLIPTAIGLDAKFFKSTPRRWRKTKNFPRSAKIFRIIFTSAVKSGNGKGGEFNTI